MKQKLFFIEIKHCPTTIWQIQQKVGLSIKFDACPSRVVPLQTAVHVGWPSKARVFAVDRSTFSICRWQSTILLSSVGMNRVTIIFVCWTSFHLYSLHFCIEQKWIAASWNGKFPFCRMRPGFYLLVFLEVVRCSLLVIAAIMADDPAPKRVLSAIGTVCEACGKHFATSDGFDKHWTSGYLVGTPCHVLDDGSTRAQLVATSRQTMSTAMLQKLKLAWRTNGTASKILSRISTYP